MGKLSFQNDTVDGRNPAPAAMGKDTIIYGVLDIPGGAGFLPSTVWVKAFICFKR